ncbi:MAG: radical SAM protein [Candidatus Omnitrophica bacterium]|nr:radical SAM protein [Candidatus Omnitrophota bacterium]
MKADPVINHEVGSVVLRPYCSNHCVFCRPLNEDSRLNRPALETMEKMAYAAISELRSQGYEKIEVSGADPLEYDGLPEYIKAVRQGGFSWVRVSTNGVRLADRHFTGALLDSGVDVFRIPLYGSRASVHDSVTREPGSFESVVRGIKNLQRSGKTKILLTSLILKQNCLDLLGIFDLMGDLGCDDLYFSCAFVSNGDFSYYVPQKLLGPFVSKLIEHSAKRGRKVRFVDMPFCVVGYDNNFTRNSGLPAHLASGFGVPGHQKTEMPDLPNYRKKIQAAFCKGCEVANKCEGLLMHDILRYGSGALSPVIQKKSPVRSSRGALFAKRMREGLPR